MSELGVHVTVCNERESILLSIKKLIGQDKNYQEFNDDIIMHINSVFMVLNQLGVGPKKPFYISGEKETWRDFSPSYTDYELIKSYVYLKVKLLFDPPTTGVLHEAMERQISEFEWRLNMQCDVAWRGGGENEPDSV